MKYLTFLLITLLGATVAAKDPNKSNEWSRIPAPIGHSPQAIGSAANGCQLGAQTLEAQGEGFISIRRWRNR